jgi:hypothetical protein
MGKLCKALICLFVLLILSGCNFFKKDLKKFSRSGITITLPNEFTREGSDGLIQFYVLSNDHTFMGNGTSKTDSYIVDEGITDLDGYTEQVLYLYKVEFKTYSDEDTLFNYAFYVSDTDDGEYTYMSITMEGESKYYAMALRCKSSIFTDDVKVMYMEWAKTIRVE